MWSSCVCLFELLNSSVWLWSPWIRLWLSSCPRWRTRYLAHVDNSTRDSASYFCLACLFVTMVGCVLWMNVWYCVCVCVHYWCSCSVVGEPYVYDSPVLRWLMGHIKACRRPAVSSLSHLCARAYTHTRTRCNWSMEMTVSVPGFLTALFKMFCSISVQFCKAAAFMESIWAWSVAGSVDVALRVCPAAHVACFLSVWPLTL